MRTHAVLLASLSLASGCAMDSSSDDMAGMGPTGGVEYVLTFEPMWTARTHPVDYPESGVFSAPHFSGLIGATHDASFDLYTPGKSPSPGLERLSEEGKHDPLDAEIRAAIASGHAGALFESDAIKDLDQPVTLRFRADDAHPLVSVVAMIAPSPDWFAGAMDVDLKDGDAWVASRSVTVYAYDSGGDDGATYAADDRDSNPKHPTMLNEAAPFVKDGKKIPVGKVTVRKS